MSSLPAPSEPPDRDLFRPDPGEPLLLRPAPLRGLLERLADSNWSWGRIAVVAAACLLVAVLGWRWLDRGRPVPIEAQLPRATSGSAPAGLGSRGSEVAGVSGADGSAIVVHVAGAVARPGLQTLSGRPRVADALAAAGGPAPDADLDRVNLAAPVADGQRLFVPRRGEPGEPSVIDGPSGGGAGAPIDLNAATAEQLDQLPGIGPASAQAIIAYRTQHGRFRSVDELLEIRGIGPAKLEQLRPLVAVQ